MHAYTPMSHMRTGGNKEKSPLLALPQSGKGDRWIRRLCCCVSQYEKARPKNAVRRGSFHIYVGLYRCTSVHTYMTMHCTLWKGLKGPEKVSFSARRGSSTASKSSLIEDGKKVLLVLTALFSNLKKVEPNGRRRLVGPPNSTQHCCG